MKNKVGAISARTWCSIVLFGLIGQIAWVVENMYFSRFMQNEITRAPYATTLLVAWSAIFATLSTLIAVLVVGGILLVGVSLVMAGLFTASYRDYIPEGKEGLFQGCRMVMYVLVPMVVGPLVSQFIINMANRGVTDDADIVYPMELFLGAAFVMLFCFIPATIVRNNQPKRHEELLKEMENENA